MRIWAKRGVYAVAVVAAIYAGPVLYNVLFQKPEDGFYSASENRCMCGHRFYAHIRGSMLVDYSIGHNDHTELYELRPIDERRYQLIGWHYDDKGTLQVFATHLLITRREENKEYKIPRVWSPWRIWFEEWRYRDEPGTDRTYEDMRKRIKDAASRTMDEPSLATP